MYVSQEVIIQTEPCYRERFRFIIFDELDFRLQTYVQEWRKTPRYKWRMSNRYSRISLRDSTIEFKDVPLTEDIIATAKNKFRDAIVYKY